MRIAIATNFFLSQATIIYWLTQKKLRDDKIQFVTVGDNLSGSAAYSNHNFSSMRMLNREVVKKTLRNFYKSLWVDLYVIRVKRT